MSALFISLGTILLLLLIFFLHKKSVGIFQKKPTSSTEETRSLNTPNDKPQAYRALLSLDENLDHSILPEGYKQRNLDREVGGLEEGKKGTKQTDEFEKHVEDLWDKRSDEIDKIGSIDPLAGHDKESMTWRLKKIRLKIGKHLSNEHEHHEEIGSGKSYDSRSGIGGFSQIVKARQDFDHENGNGGFGR
jgi:hypothetical protein